AVAADDEQAVDADVAEVRQPLGARLRVLEPGVTRAAEERPAQPEDAAHVARAEHRDVLAAVDETTVAVAHAERLPAVAQPHAHDGPDGRVHAGGVSPAREDRDSPFRHERREPPIAQPCEWSGPKGPRVGRRA